MSYKTHNDLREEQLQKERVVTRLYEQIDQLKAELQNLTRIDRWIAYLCIQGELNGEVIYLRGDFAEDVQIDIAPKAISSPTPDISFPETTANRYTRKDVHFRSSYRGIRKTLRCLVHESAQLESMDIDAWLFSRRIDLDNSWSYGQAKPPAGLDDVFIKEQS
jgi:hypothetical protein